ncbi:hypothetical protein NQ318_020108 [Aromia moschata]|uniref:Secreted protein n=1 Tax=Aromia moschata TaxID=1265417 RepID=A0AAV8ZCF0_9CUCU|nr:hypothetical protein NQ318_020108 [Aromia moschata]
MYVLVVLFLLVAVSISSNLSHTYAYTKRTVRLEIICLWIQTFGCLCVKGSFCDELTIFGNFAQTSVIEYFNPVTVRIRYESKTPHFPIVRFLDKVHAQFLEPFTSLIHVGHHNPNVA